MNIIDAVKKLSESPNLRLRRPTWKPGIYVLEDVNFVVYNSNNSWKTSWSPRMEDIIGDDFIIVDVFDIDDTEDIKSELDSITTIVDNNLPFDPPMNDIMDPPTKLENMAIATFDQVYNLIDNVNKNFNRIFRK